MKHIIELRQMAMSNKEAYKVFKEVEHDPWCVDLLTHKSAIADVRAKTTYNKYVAHSNLSDEEKRLISFEIWAIIEKRGIRGTFLKIPLF